ncbi:MAG: outer membrane beta-barrel protein [Shinella sp.]
MCPRYLLLAAAVSAAFPMTALAGEDDFFAGLDVLGGFAFGSSSTTNGGAGFGTVDEVRFGGAIGGGAHIGYRLDPDFSVSLGYQHIRSNIRWSADFLVNPPFSAGTSDFKGTASSDAILGSVAYDMPLSEATTLRGTAGLGLTFNTLSGVTETDRGTGSFVSDVAGHTKIGPVAQVGAGVRHRIAPNAVLGLDALVSYAGGFETGNTRFGNLGTTSINSYEIDRVLRVNLGASIRFAF